MKPSEAALKKEFVKKGCAEAAVAMIPPTAGEAQRLDMEKMFFMGAFYMMHQSVQAMDECDGNEETEEKVMNGINAEMEEFFQQAKAAYIAKKAIRKMMS